MVSPKKHGLNTAKVKKAAVPNEGEPPKKPLRKKPIGVRETCSILVVD